MVDAVIIMDHRFLKYFKRGVAQSGSAHDWGSCGRWFESSRPEYSGYSAQLKI